MVRRRGYRMVAILATGILLLTTGTVAAVTPPPPDPVSTSEVRTQAQAPPSPAASASVSVTARVEAVRLLVLDEEQRVLEIWSNTGDHDLQPTILARSQSVDGPLLDAVPEAAMMEYESLRGSIDWSARGLAYSAR